MKSKIILLTSMTCPNCPPAKKFLNEFKDTREDIEVEMYDMAEPKGIQIAKQFDIISIPTFLILGPKYQPIGLLGNQTHKSMNKYIDLSLGLIELKEEKGFFNKLKSIIND